MMMNRVWIPAVLLVFVQSFISIGAAGPPERIIFLSDTQDPLWFERILLSGNNNKAASNLILDRIIEEEPAAVFHLGDLVSIGYDQHSWQRIDPFLQKLAQKDIPFYPTLGNHELFMFADHGAEEFMKRFPAYNPTGYWIRVGPAVIMMLNSNFGYPDDRQIGQQQTWFQQALDACQQDTAVRVIIVGCHHPAFTNSKIVSPAEGVQKYLLPVFIENSKAKLFLSGHAHTFEHFHEHGKDFMVIGGGGGLQHPLKAGDQSRFKDHFAGADRRGFHFLRCVPGEDHMAIAVMMLKDDLSGFEVIYSIDLAY
jgi:3',5'-cyclic AMP phosphodiesterase CpdA